MNLVWTHEARLKLAEIEHYIGHDSPERAAMFIDQLVDHVEGLLPGNPRAGRIVPETVNPDIREVLFKKYRIVYRIAGKNIEILTVFEGHRLLRIDEIGL